MQVLHAAHRGAISCCPVPAPVTVSNVSVALAEVARSVFVDSMFLPSAQLVLNLILEQSVTRVSRDVASLKGV